MFAIVVHVHKEGCGRQWAGCTAWVWSAWWCARRSHVANKPHSEACETNCLLENMENCWEENLQEIHIVCNHLTSFITRHVNCQLVLCVRVDLLWPSAKWLCQASGEKWSRLITRSVAIQLCTLNEEHYVSYSCMIIGLKQWFCILCSVCHLWTTVLVVLIRNYPPSWLWLHMWASIFCTVLRHSLCKLYHSVIKFYS